MIGVTCDMATSTNTPQSVMLLLQVSDSSCCVSACGCSLVVRGACSVMDPALRTLGDEFISIFRSVVCHDRDPIGSPDA
eukprot:m.847973 g.847973  ORF g.847973 m.847973 type:complete len:79 (+) comp23487_c2_seq13:3278-3514(+)